MRLTSLAAVARRTGFPVVEENGWRGRGVNFPGPVRSVICHHDAANQAPWQFNTVVRDGRTGLAGPLSQFTIRRDGTIHVVADGRANHAGVTINDSIWGGNYSIGIEAANNGVGEPWPRYQLDAYEALVAELCREFGLGTDRVRGHKEIASPLGRKIDPAGIDMNGFRSAVAHRIAAGPGGGGGTTPPPAPVDIHTEPLLLEECTMQLEPTDTPKVVTVPLSGLPGTELLLGRAYQQFTVVGIKNIQRVRDGGIGWGQWTQGSQVVDPAKPFEWPLSQYDVFAEVEYVAPFARDAEGNITKNQNPVAVTVAKAD